MSCLCTLSRLHVVETGCQCWCWVPVLVLLAARVVETAGAGAVCWLCTWRPGAGAGAGCWLCTWWSPGGGAGAGCARGGDRVPGAGCRVLVLGAGAGCRELACRCSVLVPASDSEVLTTAASDAIVAVKGEQSWAA